MTLDATARRANILDSVKKFFVDTFETGKGLPVMFDKGLATPDLQGDTIHKWISVNLDETSIELLSDIYLRVYCCTRKDNEGFKLAQLCDTVFEELSVDVDTAPDNFKRITFYKNSPPGSWIVIGTLLVQDIIESANLEAPDETKYRIFTVRLRTPSKV